MLFYQIYRRQLQVTALILALFTWSAITSLLLLKKDHDVRIIYASSGEVRILQETDPLLSGIFLKNFLLAYTAYCFNYNAETFNENMTSCGDLMSENLWSERTPEIQRNFKSIQEKKYSVVTSLANEPKLQGDGSIEMTLKSTRFQDGSSDSIRVKSVIVVRKISLTKENSFGYEVIRAEEIPY